MLKTVLFDLDGTLLPMDNDVFTKTYFSCLTKTLAPLGYEPKQLVDGIWAGTAAMVHNDGACTNETAFWRKFASIFGERVYTDQPVFDTFYRTEFQNAKSVCGFAPESKQLVDWLKGRGVCVALATNPIFPAIATESRIRWAGIAPEDFELYTTYENIGFCKPNPQYYAEIVHRLGCKADECLMVGNDVDEDMIARELGMQVFLLTDCLINRHQKDISQYPNGGFSALRTWLERQLP